MHHHPLGSGCHRASTSLSLGRRQFLAGLASAGALTLAHGADAQMPSAQQAARRQAEAALIPSMEPAAPEIVGLVRRIDVHHHPVPPAFAQAAGAGSGLPGPLGSWSIEKSLADMDRGGVETAMLSVPAAGFSSPDAESARRLARSCNEYMAGLVQRYPRRFGFWAALPMPDVEGSLRETTYAMDTLHADGVGLLTDYRDKWLGDPSFAPLFAEIHRRGIVIYTHPTVAACCGNLIPDLPYAVVEYETDTARTIASFIFDGAAIRYPDLKIIFSHSGGTMPRLIERFVLQSRLPTMAKVTPDGVLPFLRRFYYDVAQSANPEALGALMRVVPESQVVFGTDFPYRTSIEHVAGLAGSGLSHDQMVAVGRTNALALVPRLA